MIEGKEGGWGGRAISSTSLHFKSLLEAETVVRTRLLYR